ncbi:hypothetical protein [Streptomyces chartreusis]|uniref:hypothetical protein n=1 Tax=Streptomyces chartreusis TaxID=1969 RepID=UPI0037DBF400|nr:WhiB family transcriptional regulator [Streptomyces chartreusis]
MTGTDESSAAAYVAWTEHRHYRYRGCAPDPDNPKRAAGNPQLSLDAWHGPDRDGAEPQKERRARVEAAMEVCLSCPVMVQCGRYVMAEIGEGRMVEPHGIRGGRTAKEWREAFDRRRHEVAAAAPDRLLHTSQKEAVLLALAMCPDGGAESVAAAAGVDVRTANWQRSRWVTLLCLEKGRATRSELLAEAVRRGALDASVVVAGDGAVPAVPPPTAAAAAVPASAAEVGPASRPRQRRRRASSPAAGPAPVPAVGAPVQLTLDDALEPAPVTALFPAAPVLGAAA